MVSLLPTKNFYQKAFLEWRQGCQSQKIGSEYSNHVMTDGRFVGHAGYGGQFLLVDTQTKTSISFLSVLENEDGYDDVYMGVVAATLKNLLQAF